MSLVCPGAMRTSMLDAIRSLEGGDYTHAAEPAAIARIVLGLLEPFAHRTTGQVVDRDGNSVGPAMF